MAPSPWMTWPWPSGRTAVVRTVMPCVLLRRPSKDFCTSSEMVAPRSSVMRSGGMRTVSLIWMMRYMWGSLGWRTLGTGVLRLRPRWGSFKPMPWEASSNRRSAGRPILLGVARAAADLVGQVRRLGLLEGLVVVHPHEEADRALHGLRRADVDGVVAGHRRDAGQRLLLDVVREVGVGRVEGDVGCLGLGGAGRLGQRQVRRGLRRRRHGARRGRVEVGGDREAAHGAGELHGEGPVAAGGGGGD